MVTVRRDHPGSIGGIFVMYYNPPCVQILLIAPLMQKDKFPRKLATNKTSLVSKYYSSFPKITYLDYFQFKFSYLFSLCCFISYLGTCTCSNFVESYYGYGNCGLSYQKGPMCYVNEPSNCNDSVYSGRLKRFYSWDACSKHPGRNYIISILIVFNLFRYVINILTSYH